MARVKFKRFITADTESNKDGSLYLLSTFDPQLDDARVFYNLTTFYDYLQTLGNVVVYIHNFGSWDSYFLFTEEVTTRFKVLNKIARQKKLVSVTLGYDVIEKKHRYTKQIKIEDTLPRASISLKEFAKSIGDAYNELPSYDDYRAPNKPETWSDRVTIEEYARKDVRILWKLVETFRGVYGESFDSTLSSGSMVWKEVVDQYSPGNSRWAYKRFRERFKPLTFDVDQMIRTGYMGGITTPFWNAGTVLDRASLKQLYPWFKQPVIKADDISSAYAWAQIKELPYGEAVMLKSVEEVEKFLMKHTTTVFFSIKFKYDRAKFPLIPKLHMEDVNDYEIYDDDGIVYKYNTRAKYMETMLYGNEGYASISSIDLRKAIEDDVYENFEYQIIPFSGQTDIYGILFQLKKSKEIYDVTMKYYELKNNAPTKALRFAYKQPLVNIYGKTAERYYDEERELDIVTREYVKEEKLEEPRIPRYSNVSVAATITSYVHHKLFDKGREVGFKNMLYCDTDSMFYVTEYAPLEEVETVLGTWDNEVYNPDRCLFICPKKYIIETSTEEGWKRLKSASAGVLKTDNTFTINNFMKGLRVYKTRKKVLVPQGIFLKDDWVDISQSFEEGDTYLYNDHASYE